MPEDLHAASGFALVEPHAQLECKECHFEPSEPAQPGADWLRRFPGRAPEDCEACHVDPHVGQFEYDLAQGQGCLQCHSESHFVPSGFGFEAHGDTAFDLIGKHRGVACFGCHKVPDGEPTSARQWADVSTSCADCHDDAHAGAFEKPGVPRQVKGRGGCARCHSPEGFDVMVQEAFDHGSFTDFALGGAHAQAECEACHVTEAGRDDLGRAFGRIEDRWGAKWQRNRSCALCHVDPHDGAFERAGVPGEVKGRMDCARCHTESDWHDLHTPEFDHGFWTGYELPGAHGEADCVACHLPTATTDAFGRQFGRIEAIHGTADPACHQCHPDPHFGLFDLPGIGKRVDGNTSCARCHSLTAFADLLVGPSERFDHDRWTNSDTESKHRDQTCDDCHP
ncbi:MAG: hypothetical protein P1V35_13550, partial [Planctomycetota bacterium]|nr:hypothetical protein [Planctomycetota bacterium]